MKQRMLTAKELGEQLGVKTEAGGRMRKTYPKDCVRSRTRVKAVTGETLLHLQGLGLTAEERAEGWQMLERLLRRYYV